MDPVHRGLGRCACCFWLAVAFDLTGLLVLLVGVFVNVFFYDLLIYAGAIVLFLSLIWWVFWFSGNIEVPPAELEDDVEPLKKKNRAGLTGIGGAVRRLSGRLASSVSSSFRRTGTRTGTGTSREQRSAAEPRAAPQKEEVGVAMATLTLPEHGEHPAKGSAVWRLETPPT